MVAQGLFKKRSIAVNPDMTLRHIGFLGAVPPAIKGLKNMAFAADDAAVIIEFADSQPWAMRSMAGIFRRLREMLIADGGAEKADAIIPEYAIQDIEDAARPQETPPDAASQYTESLKEDSTMEKKFTEADLAAAVEKAVGKTREDLTAEFAAQTRKDKRTAEIAAFCEDLKKQGKLIPAWEKLGLQEFMEALDAETTITFAEGGAKQTPLEFMKAFLAELPKVIEFGETASRNRDATGTAGERIETLTRAKMAEKSLNYGAAFAAVQVEHPDLAAEYVSELKGKEA